MKFLLLISLLVTAYTGIDPGQVPAAQTPGSDNASGDYRIGPQDLIEYSVLEAPEIRGSLRVSAGGEVTLPLAGSVQVGGKTPQEAESALEDVLRKSFMKDPHVSVLVHEMESHPVSVVGAVKKPGVFKIPGPKTVLEMLSLTEGLAEDAGDTVIIMRGAGLPAVGPQRLDASKEPELVPAPVKVSDTAETNTVTVNLKELLNSANSRSNVLVYPGDIVKVTRAELVYVLEPLKSLVVLSCATTRTSLCCRLLRWQRVPCLPQRGTTCAFSVLPGTNSVRRLL